ncbi:hypothetical protein KDL01_22235 [Actinospica durhamensis]|uniref:Outer membrane channel protein CpnT-like N-terminal domain-containing protein n=1 Tax=Actinospica durhamensis TaxID=1508375 RepID=A0A941ERH4_9ACTN|nr:hypothetical protein [Actinospica durhamensis]MBR7836011.1 hypothetical protein [Actinospica durhamensis]
MAVELPGELACVLGAIGVTWPDVDEEGLRAVSAQLRGVAGALEDRHADAARVVRQMLAVNASASLDVFEPLWGRVSGGHLQDLGEGIKVLADAVFQCADVVESAKAAMIAELTTYAAEAAHGETEGTAAAREAVKGVLDQAIAQIGRKIREATTAPILATLASTAGSLGGQLLGDAPGTGRDVGVSGFGGMSAKIANILGGRSPR